MTEFKKQKFINTEENYNLNLVSSNLNILTKYKMLNKQINKTIKHFIENILFMRCKFKI